MVMKTASKPRWYLLTRATSRGVVGVYNPYSNSYPGYDFTVLELERAYSPITLTQLVADRLAGEIESDIYTNLIEAYNRLTKIP